MTVEQQISDAASTKPHVVILGAGASKAAVPFDANGVELPTMDELAALTQVEGLLGPIGNDTDGFERRYACLAREVSADPRREELDRVIRDHFSSLVIPQTATIYDALLLGLREKDLLATFNWDPLLVQARSRLQAMGAVGLPEIVFLHGNVGIAVCLKDQIIGAPGTECPECGDLLAPVPLLYPVDDKDYVRDEYIAQAWQQLQAALRDCLRLTIFGYRAPKSDIAAVELLRTAWGNWEQREFEQIEVIGRPGSNPEVLRQKWDDFIHTHHFDVLTNYYDSSIAMFPRRTIEMFQAQYISANFVDPNPVLQTLDLEELVDWHGSLIDQETRT